MRGGSLHSAIHFQRRSQPLELGLVAAANFGVLVLVLDHRAAVFDRNVDPVGFPLGHLVQPNRKQPAAKSHRQLARGLFADVEVLVKSAAWRAEDASLAPAKLDDFCAAAAGIRLGAALLRPEQRISLRL